MCVCLCVSVFEVLSPLSLSLSLSLSLPPSVTDKLLWHLIAGEWAQTQQRPCLFCARASESAPLRTWRYTRTHAHAHTPHTRTHAHAHTHNTHPHPHTPTHKFAQGIAPLQLAEKLAVDAGVVVMCDKTLQTVFLDNGVHEIDADTELRVCVP